MTSHLRHRPLLLGPIERQYLEEAVQQVVRVERLPLLPGVRHERREVQLPEVGVGRVDVHDVAEEAGLVHVRQDALLLQAAQAGEEQLQQRVERYAR